MLAAQSKAASHPDVLFTPLLSGKAVLLHLGTKRYYSLNKTGSRIWQMMDKGLSLEKIGCELEAAFDVTMDQARESVMGLANQLAAEGLVHVTDS